MSLISAGIGVGFSAGCCRLRIIGKKKARLRGAQKERKKK